MKSTKSTCKKMLSGFLAALLFTALFPAGSWAQGGLTLSQSGQKVYYAGTASQFDVQISVRNDSSQTITGITGTIDRNAFPEAPFNDKATIQSLKAAETGVMTFSINTTSLTPGRGYSIPVQVTSSAGSASMKATIDVANLVRSAPEVDKLKGEREDLIKSLTTDKSEEEKAGINEAIRKKSEEIQKALETAGQAASNTPVTKVDAPRITISPNFSPLLPGQVNMLAVTVANTGNTPFNSVNFTVGALPEGMTLKNTSTLQQVGSIAVGDKKTVVFPVDAKKDAKVGNYPIAFSAVGTYMAAGKDGVTSLQSYTMEQTFYVSVGSGESSTTKRSGLSIEGIQAPPSAVPGKDFVITFQVANRGTAEAKDFKVMVEGAETVVNKSKNIFVENSLAVGQSKSYSVTFFALTSTNAKYYPIKISVEPLVAGDSKENKENAIPVIQYTGVYVDGKKGEDTDGVKSPQIMVVKYTYGGKFVEAGKNFDLSFIVKNTSEKVLRNIKISLTADEGTFIPYNTSNSVFISQMGPGTTAEKQITFSTKPDAPNKTVGITVDSVYEDMKGNAVVAKDIISIPVMQKTLLAVDDIMSQPGAAVGVPTSVNVQFYNLGKTVLSNLKVTGSGDFHIQGSPTYFAGNMDPGKSDSFEFTFSPKVAGNQAGKITFTYDNVAGEEKTLEKTFSVEVGEAPPPPEENPANLPVGTEDQGFNMLLLIPIVGIPLLVILIVVLKKRKKKKDQALEMEE